MRIEENKPLAPLTTLGIGGPARWFVEVHSEEDIAEAAAWVHEKGMPLFVLGGGSNLLVPDAGYPGIVMHIDLRGIERRNEAAHYVIFSVAAGEDWDQFVERSVDDDCAGLECLATIERVRAFDLHEQRFLEFSAEDCGFAYRRSRFNSHDRGRYIVTRVDYRLELSGAPTLRYADIQREFATDRIPSLKEVAATVRRIRQSKGMLLVEDDPDCRSAGSFFKNPIVSAEQAASVAAAAGAEPPRFSAGSGNEGKVKLPAAWLIEKAGFSKGYVLGRAGISTRHTLALVNRGGATAAEILALAEKIRSAVAERFGIELDVEPVMPGF
jgi:UDP-N-acetylmuramate dehydrogenase